MAKSDVSPVMQSCFELMVKHTALERQPGGYWLAPGGDRKVESDYGTTTIQALVARGMAAYTEYRVSRNGRFPIRVEPVINGLVPQVRESQPAKPWKPSDGYFVATEKTA